MKQITHIPELITCLTGWYQYSLYIEYLNIEFENTWQFYGGVNFNNYPL